MAFWQAVECLQFAHLGRDDVAAISGKALPSQSALVMELSARFDDVYSRQTTMRDFGTAAVVTPHM
jgi:hypothetical protein